MKQYIRMIACLLWLCAMGVGLAQTQSISGVVTDEQGVSLPGATILEQGTTNGVTTDFDGNFAIDVSHGGQPRNQLCRLYNPIPAGLRLD